MKKVYCVFIGWYLEKHIIGAFETKEEADSFVLKSNTGDSRTDPFIQEIELGGLYKHENLIPFFVQKIYYKDKDPYEHINFSEFSKEFKKLKLSVRGSEGDPQQVREFAGIIWAESKEHAQKILGEYTLDYNSHTPLQ